ncbi:uncharacterized protein TNCT_54821 [Trichonephila clavata]|uniref:Uncharacterized protein n=1 Tax=Trichonephila clavata TaxID=2740835 RepID=A0A8X6KCC8_TRICU|nr:uncharacterized protein TNCT_54821 [Trichonephila clavata]
MSDNRTVASILLAEPSANRNSNHVVSYPFNNNCINLLFFYLRIFCILSGLGIILLLVFYEQRSVFLYVLISMTSLIVCLVFIDIVLKYKTFCVSHSKKLNSSTRINSSSIEHFILQPELKECSERNVYKISSVECLNAILPDVRVTSTGGSCSKSNEKIKFGYFSSTFGIRRIEEIEV